MSPDDSNNPGLNTNPDLTSVPLPEPAQVQSPYAPPSGTLGEIAENVSSGATMPNQQPTAIPTPGIITDEQGDPNTSDSQTVPEVASANGKSKNNKLPLIIGIIIVVLAAAGLIVFLILAKPFSGENGNGDGGHAGGGAFFASDNFFISSREKGAMAYAIYNSKGKAVTGFDYSGAPDYFIANTALVRKGSKYGLIDTEGNEVVSFDKYDKIDEYGGLYGVLDDGKHILINNKGEKVVEYSDDNINNYTAYSGGKASAYTMFRSSDHYTVYSPYGAKVIEFDSSLQPTVSTQDMGKSGAKTIIVYSGGVIVLDDKGNEIRRIQRSITKRFFGIFISDNSNLIGLSTTNEPVVVSFSTISTPNDKRDNALVIGDLYHDFSNKKCAGLYYDKTYADDDGGYVLCANEGGAYPITSTGDIAPNSISPYSIKHRPSAIREVNSVYPISLKSYAIVTESSLPGEENLSIFYKDKKKANFVSGKTTHETNDGAKTKTATTVNYKLLGMVDGYIVNRIEQKIVDKYPNDSFNGAPERTRSASGKVIFYNEEGEEICTFSKIGYYGTTERANMFDPSLKSLSEIDSNSVGGFINGVAQVKKIDGLDYTNINTKCEIEDEKAAYGQTEVYGKLSVTTKKASKGYTHELRDRQNKIIATTESDFSSVAPLTYAEGYYVFSGKDKKYFVVGDRVLKEFKHFCAMNSGITFTERYVELSTAGNSPACNDSEAVGGEHYYFLPNGEQFYYWKE